jgi:hypothetical protein
MALLALAGVVAGWGVMLPMCFFIFAHRRFIHKRNTKYFNYQI